MGHRAALLNRALASGNRLEQRHALLHRLIGFNIHQIRGREPMLRDQDGIPVRLEFGKQLRCFPLEGRDKLGTHGVILKYHLPLGNRNACSIENPAELRLDSFFINPPLPLRERVRERGLTKIYTKTGDKGTTQLLSVGRVPKNHLRLQAYGDIDELNSVIGLARAQGLSPPLDQWLLGIQNTLFVLSSEIAVPKPDEINMPIPKVTPSDTAELEKMIDELDSSLEPLKTFILPGGSPGAAQLHVARTVCRRAERSLQTLHQSEPLSADALTYINRLSDLLFTMARYENKKRDVNDTPWSSQ